MLSRAWATAYTASKRYGTNELRNCPIKWCEEMLSLQSDSVWLQICVQNSSHHAEFLFNVAFRVKCFKCSSKGKCRKSWGWTPSDPSSPAKRGSRCTLSSAVIASLNSQVRSRTPCLCVSWRKALAYPPDNHTSTTPMFCCCLSLITIWTSFSW